MRKLRVAPQGFSRSRRSRPDPLCGALNMLKTRPHDRWSGREQDKSMRGITMTKFKLFSLLAAIVLVPATLLGQATASLHGHVNNAAGLLIPDAQVKLTTDKTAQFK